MTIGSQRPMSLSLSLVAVELLGGLATHEPLRNVPCDGRAVALRGVAEAAAPGRIEQHLVALLEDDVGELRRRHGPEHLGEGPELRVARALDQDRAVTAGAAPLQAPCPELALGAIEERVGRHLGARPDAHDPPGAEPAAVASGATG